MLGAGLVIGLLGGCGLSWSGDDSGRLQAAVDELASVGGPDGQQAEKVAVHGCDDSVEMPMGAAVFEYDGVTNAGITKAEVDATNAEWQELNEWYAARWKRLGWTVQEEYPQVTKTVDGKRLRASVDANNGSTYTVTVVRDGAGLCS